MQQVSDYELELLKIIWNGGGKALYAEIVGALEDRGTPLTKNTVITLLSRLIDKGYLKIRKIGRRNEYSAIISEETYQSAQTQTFLNKIYEGSARGLVSTLIQKDLLSLEDFEALKKHWEGGADDR